MNAVIETMEEADIEAAIALWQATPGMGLDPELDAPRRLRDYLARLPGASHVARLDGELVGTVLVGTDGRRGYLHHLAVVPACRGAGVGRALVEAGMGALVAAGITRAHAFIFADNEDGRAFWRAAGWRERDDLVMVTGQA